MNRVGLKDYLLNHADDNDLLDCAKAWDLANQYGQFDTYESVEEAAEVTDWDVAQALNEARRVDQDADFFRLNGYGHLESVSKASLLEDARDNIDDIGLEPEEWARIAERAQAKEQVRTQGPDIGVEIDSYNDDGFITGTVTVDGESCYFYCPNNTRNQNDYDSVILEPFRPVGFEGDIEDVDLPAAIDENREIVELIVSMEAAPYMDPDKLPGSEQSLDSLCDEKSDEAQSMRYGMEGVGLPMLDAAEHLANY